MMNIPEDIEHFLRHQTDKLKFIEFDKVSIMNSFKLKREQANKLLKVVDEDPHVNKMFNSSEDPAKFLHDFL